MKRRSYKIAPFLGQACKFLAVSPDRVLARAGLSSSFAMRDEVGLAASDWLTVVEALVTEAGSPECAMELGRRIAVGPLHPALIGFSASSDIRSGVERIALFKPLIAPVVVTVQETVRGLSVTLEAATGSKPSPTVALMEIAYFIELFRTFSGQDITPEVVCLPSDAQVPRAFCDFVGCEVQLGDHVGFVLSDDVARTPIISADTDVYRAVEEQLLARLRALDREAAIADRVRKEIEDLLPSGKISIEAVSLRLRTSTRSLQRRLKEEGVSFQDVLDDTRSKLAIKYLRDQKLSIEETSYLLAFRDPNSFYRAFNEWTGLTPSEARSSA